MSDTPRTDREETEDAWTPMPCLRSVSSSFARQLERELNANVKAFSDYMTKATIEANDLKHEIGNLRQYIELLKEQNRVLGEEIGGGP